MRVNNVLDVVEGGLNVTDLGVWISSSKELPLISLPGHSLPFPSLWLESSSLQFCEDLFSPFDPSTDTFPIRIREALTTRRLLEEGGELLLVLCATWGVGNSEDVKVCNTAIDYDIRVHRR